MVRSFYSQNNSSLYIVEPSGPHTHSLILLHGLGSNGEKFGRELVETGICSDGKSLTDLLPGARLIFPTSKKRRSSAFRRAMLTQWFDVALLEDPSYRNQTQYQGLEESSREIFHLISEERGKISDKNILIGGISQGCAMSIVCLLALGFPIGGFVGMSGWLPFASEIQKLAADDDESLQFSDDSDPFAFSSNGENDSDDGSTQVYRYARGLLSLQSPELPTASDALTTPVFLGHGEEDEKIKLSLGEEACRVLRSVVFQVEWASYQGRGHWYKVPDEIDDIVRFFTQKAGWSLQLPMGQTQNDQ
ncbi:hypothetical protein NW762_014059 [Fusarium torreyae]|uniref:Phospholipase/carboxylesterase/thioesterase domain-containing protein n=1 Tax=Fusarium torreyae TaxID=1237075 RepID=A0A9W8V781_9HYPO|nr:hypothetical protein NW762_014059 [Fusarium torreyae]